MQVAFEYAKGSNGLIFEMYMGMVDKGADLTALSQYPHEREICFREFTGSPTCPSRLHPCHGFTLQPTRYARSDGVALAEPLTALEVRGTHVEGSVTIVEVDARVCPNVLDELYDPAEIQAFKHADEDESGELSLQELGRLARERVPDASDEHLKTVFQAADLDHSGLVDFTEYREVVIPKLRDVELDVRNRKEAEAKEAQARAILQEREKVQALVSAHERQKRERALARQEKKLRHEFDEVLAQKAKDFNDRVKAEVAPLKQSVAQLAAEMFIGHGTERTTPPSSRNRKCAKLAKAIEGAALSEAALLQRTKTTKGRSEPSFPLTRESQREWRRGVRSQSPRPVSARKSSVTHGAGRRDGGGRDGEGGGEAAAAAAAASTATAGDHASTSASAAWTLGSAWPARSQGPAAGTFSPPRTPRTPRPAEELTLTPRLDLSEFTGTPRLRPLAPQQPL